MAATHAAAAAGGVATFAVLSPLARNTDAFDAVHPSGMTLLAHGRATRFDLTGVLSTSFDLPFFVTAPLIHHCVASNAPATLVVCSPHHKSREGRNTVMNLTCHLLPSIFAAAGPQCSEVAVQVVEVRHSSIIDALNIRRVASLAEVEWASVINAGARVTWDAILEKLSERYSRGLASAEDSAFIVQIRLPSGGIFTLCDAGAASTHLGNLTLVLNSGSAVPQDKRTIAPRIGLTFALEPLLPPQGLVHVLVLPDPSVDEAYTLRVLRFATGLHSVVPPLTEKDLFPDDALPLGGKVQALQETGASTAKVAPPRAVQEPPQQDEFTEYPIGSPSSTRRPPLGGTAAAINVTDVATPVNISAIATHRPRHPTSANGGTTNHMTSRAHEDHEVSSESDSSDEDDVRPRGDVPRGLPRETSAMSVNASSRFAPDDNVMSPHALANAYLGPASRATASTSPAKAGGKLRAPASLLPQSPAKTTPGGGLNSSIVTAASARGGEPSSSVVQRLRDRLAECEEQLLQSRHTLAAFEAELQRARKANTELSQALDEATHENETLRGVATAAQQEGREMSDLLRKLSQRLTELQDSSQAHRDETSGLKSIASEATAEAERLKRELHDAKRTLKLLESREKERIRNATLVRAAGGALGSSDAPVSSKNSVASGAASSTKAGGGRSSSVSKGDAAAVASTKKRLQELVNENAKLHLKIDGLNSELAQYRAYAGRHSSDGASLSKLGFASPSTSEEMSALRTEVEVLRAQLATQAAEIDHLSEERAALQRVVVTHPRSNAASDVLMAVSQSCLRGLELLLSKMRAEVASVTAGGGNANAIRSLQQHRAAQIHAVEKLKASIVAVSQKDTTLHIPASATANDIDPMSQAMKYEIERLAHVKALLPTYAQLYAQCMLKRGQDGDASMGTDTSSSQPPPTFGKP